MNISTLKTNIGTLKVLNPSTSVPVRLNGASATFRKAWVMGKKDYQTNNTGTVHIGSLSSDGGPSYTITTGTVVEIEAPPGFHLDFYDFWLDVATASDGVIALYCY